MIEVSAKIWRTKVVSKYKTPNLGNTYVDKILDYGQYGKCLYKPKLDWNDGSKRHDIIIYDANNHVDDLTKDLKFDISVDKETRAAVTSIITEFWDCFVKEGAKRTILGYKFGTDTGGSKPVCCQKILYSSYE